MLRCKRCGGELGAGDNVRLCNKCGAEHTLKDDKWHITCKGGNICESNE